MNHSIFFVQNLAHGFDGGVVDKVGEQEFDDEELFGLVAEELIELFLEALFAPVGMVFFDLVQEEIFVLGNVDGMEGLFSG